MIWRTVNNEQQNNPNNLWTVQITLRLCSVADCWAADITTPKNQATLMCSGDFCNGLRYRL